MPGAATLVHHFLEASAEAGPDRELVVRPGGRFSYAAVEAEANRLANLLLARGVERGDRVALLAHNSELYVQAYYAILKAGAVAVPINTASDATMLAGFLADAGARILIAGPTAERLVQHAAGGLPELDALISPNADKLANVATEHVRWDTPAAEHRPAVPIDPDDLASIIYTSGSTGRPRGAMLSHANLVANVSATVGYLRLDASDRVLQVLPFYYVYGKSVLNTHVAAGGTVVIDNRFRYPNTVLDHLEAERCTGLSGVPSTFAVLLDRSNFAERPLASLRYVTQAGGGMSPALIRRLIASLPGREIFIMYGATEASARLAYLPPDELANNIGSIGRALPGVTLRVERPDGSECVPGEVGELVARGPSIMRGYWQAPEETARVLDGRDYHTGDLARRDERGLLYIVGRTRDMIKAGGHRIAAREIEDALTEHPAVHEAAVIGVVDAVLGEQLHAVVALNDGDAVTGEALARFLATRLPAYKVPRSFELRTELPKNESGKVMKELLRADGQRRRGPSSDQNA